MPLKSSPAETFPWELAAVDRLSLSFHRRSRQARGAEQRQGLRRSPAFVRVGAGFSELAGSKSIADCAGAGAQGRDEEKARLPLDEQVFRRPRRCAIISCVGRGERLTLPEPP